MRFFLLLLSLSTALCAETYTVTHQGHSYEFSAEDVYRFKSAKANLSLMDRPCAKFLRAQISEKFEKALLRVVKNPKNSSQMIKVQSSSQLFFVDQLSDEGKMLRNFPEEFAKAVLVQKELCK